MQEMSKLQWDDLCPWYEACNLVLGQAPDDFATQRHRPGGEPCCSLKLVVEVNQEFFIYGIVSCCSFTDLNMFFPEGVSCLFVLQF